MVDVLLSHNRWISPDCVKCRREIRLEVEDWLKPIGRIYCTGPIVGPLSMLTVESVLNRVRWLTPVPGMVVPDEPLPRVVGTTKVVLCPRNDTIEL